VRQAIMPCRWPRWLGNPWLVTQAWISWLRIDLPMSPSRRREPPLLEQLRAQVAGSGSSVAAL
jgi:hypothetical protein